MDKQKIVLHFGAHKTGTSLLQKFMRDRPDQVQKSSVYAISRSETNILLGWGNKFTKDPSKLIDRIDSLSVQDFKYIVVSHENALGRPFVKNGTSLYPDAGELISMYRTYLSAYDVHFVFYVRDVADFVESYYIQTVQEGSTMSFAKWFNSFGGTECLSWIPLLEAINQANFNSTSIINFSESISQGQISFISQFFSTFMEEEEVSNLQIDYNAARNISVGALGLKLLKACNKHVSNAEERRLLRKFFQANFNNSKYPKPNLLDSDQKSFIAQKYGNEFEQFTFHGVPH